MRKSPHRVWMILFVGVALLTIASIARVNAGRDRIPWQENLSTASRESALTRKPIFLYFTASWCGPCQSLKTSTWADTKVAEALSKYVPVKIDLDAHHDLAEKYHVTSIPMFLILDSNAQPIKSSIGYLGPDQFLEWLKE